MSTGDLVKFLQQEQREMASQEDALKLIDKYEPDLTGNSSITAAGMSV